MTENLTNIDLDALALDVDEAIRAAWEKDKRDKWAPTGHYASRAGHPCRYYLWAVIAKWRDLPTPDTDLLGIFRSGSETEESVMRDLRDAGFVVTRQQTSFEDRDLRLRGKVDAFISRPDHPVFSRPRPIEVKSMHPAIFEQVHSFDDLLTAKRPWLRKYPGQILLYGYLASEPLVGMILRDKSSRRTRTIWTLIDRHWDILEAIGENLVSVNRHLDEGTEPEPIGYTPDLCDPCECAAICPAMLNRRGMGAVNVVQDGLLDELLSTMRENAAAAKAYDAAEKKLKATLEGAGYWSGDIGTAQTIVTSQYRITCTIGKTTRKELPPGVEPVVREIPTKRLEWVPLDANEGAK